jgi:pimeloyl-ACP methyl ester carboxylesterase
VAATQRALARQDGPTILVGHSWGGTVITEAGTNPKVVGLVYVSALSPDAGETTSEQYAGFSAPDFVIDTQADGYGFVSLEKFKIGFAGDASDADAAFLRDSQVRIGATVEEVKASHAVFMTQPKKVADVIDRAARQAGRKVP